jgi:hypothetical protein
MSKGGGEATRRMNERYSRYSGAHHLFSSTLTIIVCPVSEWPQAAKKEEGVGRPRNISLKRTWNVIFHLFFYLLSILLSRWLML